MSTTIEWTEETWNPTTGCDRISPGCRECYAATLAKRLKAMGQPKYQNDGDPVTSGPGFALTCHPDTLGAPLGWRKGRLVFVNSMSDLFHRDVPDQFIAEVFAVMALAPQHTFQVLTKRAHRMGGVLRSEMFALSVENAATARVPSARVDTMQWPLPNVWLGVSIENDRYTWRADHLRHTPAAVRFISAEPLLGPLPSLDLTGIDWLIAGGESGPNARPVDPEWVRDLRDRCTVVDHTPCGWSEIARTGDPFRGCDCHFDPRPAFLFKQWGGRTPKAGGRELDGRTWDEYPEASSSRGGES